MLTTNASYNHASRHGHIQNAVICHRGSQPKKAQVLQNRSAYRNLSQILNLRKISISAKTSLLNKLDSLLRLRSSADYCILDTLAYSSLNAKLTRALHANDECKKYGHAMPLGMAKIPKCVIYQRIAAQKGTSAIEQGAYRNLSQILNLRKISISLSLLNKLDSLLRLRSSADYCILDTLAYSSLNAKLTRALHANDECTLHNHASRHGHIQKNA